MRCIASCQLANWNKPVNLTVSQYVINRHIEVMHELHTERYQAIQLGRRERFQVTVPSAANSYRTLVEAPCMRAFETQRASGLHGAVLQDDTMISDTRPAPALVPVVNNRSIDPGLCRGCCVDKNVLNIDGSHTQVSHSSTTINKLHVSTVSSAAQTACSPLLNLFTFL